MGLTMTTKRVNLTLPGRVYDQLEEVADQQGRSLPNLVAFICELCLNTGYGLAGSGIKDPAQVPDEQQVLTEFIFNVVTNSKPSAATLLLTAKITGISPEILAKMIKVNGHDEQLANSPQ
jgi:hypothetical protein